MDIQIQIGSEFRGQGQPKSEHILSPNILVPGNWMPIPFETMGQVYGDAKRTQSNFFGLFSIDPIV